MNLVRIENGGENSMSLVDFMKAAELTELRFLKSNDPKKTTQWVSTPFGRVFLSEKTDVSDIHQLTVFENDGSTDPTLKGSLWIGKPSAAVGTVIKLA